MSKKSKDRVRNMREVFDHSSFVGFDSGIRIIFNPDISA